MSEGDGSGSSPSACVILRSVTRLSCGLGDSGFGSALIAGFASLSSISALLLFTPADAEPSVGVLELSLRGRFLSGSPSQTNPFSRHVRQFNSPEHLIFFRLQVRQAARTRPDRFSLWPGSEMKRNVFSFADAGEFGTVMAGLSDSARAQVRMSTYCFVSSDVAPVIAAMDLASNLKYCKVWQRSKRMREHKILSWLQFVLEGELIHGPGPSVG